jgi:hypothetical protein
MRPVVTRIVLCAMTLGILATAGAQDTVVSAPSGKLENFRLTASDGRSWELFYQGDFKAVALLAFDPEDPACQSAAKALEALRAAHESALSVAAINVRSSLTREQVQSAADTLGVKFPVLMDPTQRIAKSLGFTHAGETLLSNPAEEWRVLYRGAATGADGAAVLAPVIDTHLAGQPVTLASVAPGGAAITYADPGDISYAKDIVPILQDKCISCHHEGGLGPFAMSNYKKVHGWADMMRETVRTKRMPPWHADPEMGDYLNSRALTTEQEAKLLAWIEAGAPQGGEEDPLANAALPVGTPAWQLGTPDHVVALPEVQELPAEGIVDYRYIPVEANITEDKWLRALEVRTDNLPVLHHALIFVTYPKEYRHIQPDAHSGLNGYFAAYLPGAQLFTLPDDSGIFLPKGSVFTFQMHYNTTGKPEKERCEMALYFRETPPEKVVLIEAASETDFTIPPNAGDEEVHADYEFDQDAELLGMSPHMHYRGSRFKFAANYPDGELQTLLNVPFYEFDWQPMYILEKPLRVPQGTRIECVGAFDNSKFNKKNPNPGQLVYFGEQSFEEMFIGYVQFAVPLDAKRYKPREINEEDYVGLGEKITPESIVGMQFRIRRNLVVEFKEDGRVESSDGTVKGKYRFENNNTAIIVNSIFGEIEFGVVGDEMFMNGRPLRRAS